MLRYINLLILFITLNLAVGYCAGQIAGGKPLIVRYDSINVQQKEFSKPALQHYEKQNEFNYIESYQGLSLWERFWRWIWGFFDEKDASVVSEVVTYTLIALGVAALVFLIMKLAGVNPFWVLRGKSAEASLPYSEDIENIHELNADDEISKAISVGNYRLAVRMLYLKTLKQLNEAGLIHWDSNKTNHQYSNELNNPELKLKFNSLTRQFEYIWYGEFNIDATAFEQVKGMFNDFKVKQYERL